MLLVWIPVSVLAMYFVLNIVYGRLWKKGLKAELCFEERDVEEGDDAVLVETVTNDKVLPLPVIKLSFKMDRSVVIDQDRNASVTDLTNVVEYFGLGGREAVTRRQPVRASKRGYFLIREADIVMPDFFSEGIRYMTAPQSAALLVCPGMLDDAVTLDLSRQIIGEVRAKRRLYQDVFSFRGIREYTPADPLNAVNWKASARTGRNMVNIRDFTSGQQVRILLDLEPPAIRCKEELLEKMIRLAYTLAGSCIREQIPVSMASNGRDLITGRALEMEAGNSERHLGAVGEALARISLPLTPAPFADLLRQERRELGRTEAVLASDMTVCMICGSLSDDGIDEADALSDRCGGLIWICPFEPDVGSTIPSGIRFMPIRL